MYKFTVEQVLDEKFLTKLVEKFRNREVRKYDKLDRYYMTENDAIRLRSMKRGKPNNKIAHGYARYISNMATSYFMGKPIRYQAEDDEYNLFLQEYMDDTYNHNYEISKSASKKGISFELLYVNETSNLKSKKYDAQEIIPIYSSRTDEFLECGVHIWEERDLDGNLLWDYADVYDASNIWRFKRRTKAALYTLYDIQPHLLPDVPIIVYWNNEEQMGDYDCVISQIDAYDRAQSNTANDMDYFTDAYLVLTGASGGLTDAEGNELSPDDADRTLRNNRLILLDEKGTAQFLTKNAADTQTENYKDRLFKDIFFISQVPPMTDESFAGDLSGIALRYKLIGLEQLAIMKENKFRLAQQKKLKILTSWINLKESRHFDPSTVKQVYERNFIDNTTEMIANAGNLEGIVSRETQLSALPSSIVTNAKEELKRMKKEESKKEGMYKEPLEESMVLGGEDENG